MTSYLFYFKNLRWVFYVLKTIFIQYTKYLPQLAKPQTISIYTIKLKMNGTGFAITLKDNSILLQYGYSHQILIPVPIGSDFHVSITGKKQKILLLRSSIKQRLINFAVVLQKLYPLDKYHGKGLFFVRNTQKLKTGKKKFN